MIGLRRLVALVVLYNLFAPLSMMVYYFLLLLVQRPHTVTVLGIRH